MTRRYLDRLATRSAATGTVLCLGLDPDPANLPGGFSRDVTGIERFATLVLEAALPFAAAVKPNVAFYEAFGSAGIAALERLRARIPDDVPVIADVKRADIGSTATRQAVALFDELDAHAVTVSPYLGAVAIEPLIERSDRYAYVLCRTSGPGSHEFQDLVVEADQASGAPAEPLHVRIARRVTGWGPGGTVGLVVGATAPGQMRAIRAVAPGLGFLVPGVGAQGGGIESSLAEGRASAAPAGDGPGGGLVVNVSRGIAGAALEPGDGDPLERVAAAAAGWAASLPVLP